MLRFLSVFVACSVQNDKEYTTLATAHSCWYLHSFIRSPSWSRVRGGRGKKRLQTQTKRCSMELAVETKLSQKSSLKDYDSKALTKTEQDELNQLKVSHIMYF